MNITTSVNAGVHIEPVDIELPLGFMDECYGGGVRVKSIKQIDKNEVVVETKMDYANGLLMSPVTLYTSVLVTPFRFYSTIQHDYCITDPDFYHIEKTSSSMTPISYDAQGGLVGYEEVIIEEKSNIQQEENGYTINHFIIAPPATKENMPSVPNPFNGKLIDKKRFDSGGNEVYSISYEYDSVMNNVYYGFKPTLEEYVGTCMRYQLVSSSVNLEKTTEYFRDNTGNKYNEKIKEYSYNDYNMLKTLTENTSFDDKEILTSNVYVADIENPNGVYDDMQSENVISPLKSTTRIIIANSATAVTQKHEFDYELGHSITIPDDGTTFNAYNNHKITQYPSGDISATIETDIAYDDKGNILHVDPSNDLPVSYIWGYAQTKPIARFINANTFETGYTGFEHAEGNGWSKEHLIVEDSEAHSGRYVAKVGLNNSTDQYGPTGLFNIDDFDSEFDDFIVSVFVKSFSTSPYLRIQFNEDYSTSETVHCLGTGVWEVLQIEIKKEDIEPYTGTGGYIKVYVGNNSNSDCYFDDIAFKPAYSDLTTYTYAHLRGVTSKTASDHTTIYYEYDEFGRLKLLRDTDGNILEEYEYNYQPQP